MSKIKISRRRLRADLAAKAPFWPVFEQLAHEAGARISEDTIKRILDNGTATLRSLSAIAKALGTRPEYYFDAAEDAERPVSNISGEWTALYIETWPPFFEKSITTERLIIKQAGSWVKGTYEFLSNSNPSVSRDTIFEMRARITGNFVTGFYFVRGRKEEQGIGSLQLKLLDQARFAEGFCTYCSETEVASMSANIWIKQGEETSKLYNTHALALIEQGEFFTRPKSR